MWLKLSLQENTQIVGKIFIHHPGQRFSFVAYTVQVTISEKVIDYTQHNSGWCCMCTKFPLKEKELWFFSYKFLSHYLWDNCCMLNSSKDEYLKLIRSQIPDIYTAHLSLLSLSWKTRLSSFLQKLILESMGILCQKPLMIGLKFFLFAVTVEY